MALVPNIIRDEDGKGFTLAFGGDDVEFVNPTAYYREKVITRNVTVTRAMLHLRNPVLTGKLSDEFFLKEANKEWEGHLNRIKSTQIPPNFIHLLEADSKHNQEKLLKGQALTPDQLTAFLFQAWEKGFLFSNYRSEHHYKGLDVGLLPKLIYVEQKGVRKVGRTPLTDGQLKQIIEQRKVVVAKFLDRGSDWHCFFVTYRSLRKEETWKNGQQHFHYLSNKWGISREDALKQLKSTKYPPTSIHIELHDYDECMTMMNEGN